MLIHEDIPRLARIYNNLGIACRGLEDYPESETYFELALDSFSEHFGKHDFKVGLVLNSIV